MLAIGTTLSVYPIAGVVPVAKGAGARVVILNAEPTEMDDLADAVIRGPIGALLPRLVGLRRAQAVAALLTKEGIDPSILEITSHGKDNPLVPTADQVFEPRNRRVEVTVR